MRRQLLAAAGAWAVWVGAAAAAAPDFPRLVAQLGSDSYPEREAAARALESGGAAALPALRGGEASDDPETRRRAAGIAAKIRRGAENAALVQPRRVALDYQNVPLGTAVNDLKARTGIPLALHPAAVAHPLRPVTAKTAELPAWEAVEAFCRAAGLREVFAAEFDPPKPPPNARRGAAPPRQFLTAATTPVTLADGPPDGLPADRVTAVRVVAMPPGFPGTRVVLGTQETTLCLDITPLPGLNWQDATEVRVRRAVDEKGRAVVGSQTGDAADGPVVSEDGIVVMGGPGQVVIWNDADFSGRNLARLPIPNPRVVPLALRTTADRPRRLAVLEGTVVGDVVQANQPLAVVPDIGKAVGVAVPGANGTTVTVLASKAGRTAGTVAVRVRTDGPSALAMLPRPRRGMNAALAMGLIEPVAPVPGPTYQLFDADGRAYTGGQMNILSGDDDGQRSTMEVELLFRRGPETGPAARLVMLGSRTVTAAVPFRLENVPLP